MISTPQFPVLAASRAEFVSIFFYSIDRKFIRRAFLCVFFVVMSIFIPADSLADGHANVILQSEQEASEDGPSMSLNLVDTLIEPIREELLSIELPDTERRNHIGISVRPDVADIFQEDYIRMPVKFRYGLTKNIELSVMPGTYIHNPRRKTAGFGVADMDFGFKYNFLRILRKHVSMAFAFNTLYPVGSNPDLMDGFVHYKPKLIVLKTLKDFHKIEVVSSIGWDMIDGATEPLEEEDEGQLDITELSLGFKLPRDPYAWSLEFVYTTERPDGGDFEGFIATPGWHWYIPREQAQWFPGDISLSLGVSFGIMDAENIDYVTKVNASIPLKVIVDLKERNVEFESKELSEALQKIRRRMERNDPPEEGETPKEEGGEAGENEQQ